MTRWSMCIAAAVAVLAGAAFTFLMVRDDSAPTDELRQIVDRLNALDERIEMVDRRLDRYLLDEPLIAGVDGSVENDLTGSALDESTDGPEDSPSELESLRARLRDLDLRVRGLEVDPVERGFSFLESDNPSLRRQGVLMLRRVAGHDPQALEALREMLQDPDRGVRLTTLDVLGDAKDKQALPAIEALLSDPEASVRREAIFGLLRLGGREQGEAISEMLGDPDRTVRKKAAYALGRLDYNEATELLVAALRDQDEQVRGEVIVSLGQLSDKRALPVLRDLYDNDPGDHRYRLVRALKSMGDVRPFETEFTRLSEIAEHEESADARLEAIRALSWFARSEARELFKKALKDPNSRVRNEARRALGWSSSRSRKRR